MNKHHPCGRCGRMDPSYVELIENDGSFGYYCLRCVLASIRGATDAIREKDGER